MAQVSDCTNCGNDVPVRRPSLSGHHYCQRKECQAAKQKFYRSRRAKLQEESVLDEAFRFFSDALNGSRTTCHACGLENALLGWAHRDVTLFSICSALGTGPHLIGGRFVDTLYPERDPRYVSAPEEQE